MAYLSTTDFLENTVVITTLHWASGFSSSGTMTMLELPENANGRQQSAFPMLRAPNKACVPMRVELEEVQGRDKVDGPQVKEEENLLG